MSLAHNPRIVTNGLVLALDAANPKSYPGSGTNWFDLSKNGYNATAINSPTYSTNSKGIFSFDGTSEYFTTTHLMDQNAGSAYTCLAFAKLSNTGNGRIHILSTDNAGYDWSLGAGDGNKFIMFTGAAVLGGAPQDTNWHMHAAVWSDAGAILYMDGVQQATAAIGNDSSNNPTYIGKNPGFNEYWKGDIGFVALYNRVLIQDEILQNFNALRGRYGL